LSAIRAFEAAARHGSFTKAAEELGMTQAAVSYQVKLLEDRVGMALFLRQPRRVVLSEAGQRLAPAVAPEMPTKLGRPCFDWVASPGRTVTTSFPSRSPMMVGSAPAGMTRSPMAASISRSLRMPLS